MKVVIVLVALLMLAPAIAPLATAQVYNATYSCPKNACVQGGEANWTVFITNRGDNQLELLSFTVLDNRTGKVMALYNGSRIYVSKEKTVNATVQGILEAPGDKNLLHYHVCFTSAIDVKERIDTSFGVFFGLDYTTCPLPILAMPVATCGETRSCAEAYYCLAGTCYPLQCNSCQFVSGNSCVSYECCDNVECNLNEACVANRCRQLSCGEQETLRNHSCVPLDCATDERVLNHRCVPLECSENEYAADHSCVPLDCATDERARNHACIPLECAPLEHAVNNTCVPLNCPPDKIPRNNQCEDVRCWYFQNAAEHRCVNNQTILRAAVAEAAALAAILLLGVLFWRRHRTILHEEKSAGEKVYKQQSPGKKQE